MRVLLACSGLEHANRGYESFARECFERLKDEPRIDMQLVKGSGSDGDRERSVASIKRDDRIAAALGRIRGNALKVEQAAFGFSVVPEIRRTKPDVIYFSEWYTGVVLNKLRRLSRHDYALVLSNGSMAPTGFEHFDRVHQHTQPALEYVLARGADPTRQILLPVAFGFPESVPTADERLALKDRLGLPRERKVLTSVAALNRSHKRLDYIITEVARLPEERRPFLLLVGQPEPETGALREFARGQLGDAGHSFRTVSRAEVDLLLRASDLFVLASLAEGLPRALVEAMGHGLPCLAHDYRVAEFATGPHGLLADLTQEGGLAALVERAADSAWDPARAEERRRFVYDNFSWDTLTPQYVDMLAGAKGRAPFPS